MAVLSGRYRRNSAPAIRECFEHGVGRIELDVHSLAGDDYAVFHDRRLEASTDGSGSIGRVTTEQVRSARFIDAPDEHPPLLSEIVAMAGDCDTEIQLDLKDWRPLPDERLRVLSEVIEPIKARVIVSTGQDWNLARLHRFDPEIAFGFDPGHYIDHGIEGADVFLPRTMGAYGYRDDHPLAFGRTEDVTDYLHERMEAIVMQAPGAREFFLSHRLVLQMLEDGFNVADWLHNRAMGANVWTPDYRGPESVAVMERLAAAGVDRVTTNTATAWSAAFASPP
jgi:glycerophosphoryl diester phosphodiesterase